MLMETTKNDQIRTPTTWKDKRSVEQHFNAYTRLVIDLEQICTSEEMKQVDLEHFNLGSGLEDSYTTIRT